MSSTPFTLLNPVHSAEPIVVLILGAAPAVYEAPYIQLLQQQIEPDDFKTMKDHVDLDSQNKKPPGRDLKEIAGSFW